MKMKYPAKISIIVALVEITVVDVLIVGIAMRVTHVNLNNGRVVEWLDVSLSRRRARVQFPS